MEWIGRMDHRWLGSSGAGAAKLQQGPLAVPGTNNYGLKVCTYLHMYVSLGGGGNRG
jgi:hypothetical protein